LKIIRIDSKPDALVILFHPTAAFPDRTLNLLLEKYQRRLRFLSGFSLQVTLEEDQWEDRFKTLWSILQAILEIQGNPQ
ncbi:MAG: hypothetical protein ACREIQ_00295, partial [Nitrospiria bacterium]